MIFVNDLLPSSRKTTSRVAVPVELVQFLWEVVDKNGGRGTEERIGKQFKHKLRTARSEYGKALMSAAANIEEPQEDNAIKGKCILKCNIHTPCTVLFY